MPWIGEKEAEKIKKSLNDLSKRGEKASLAFPDDKMRDSFANVFTKVGLKKNIDFFVEPEQIDVKARRLSQLNIVDKLAIALEKYESGIALDSNTAPARPSFYKKFENLSLTEFFNVTDEARGRRAGSYNKEKFDAIVKIKEEDPSLNAPRIMQKLKAIGISVSGPTVNKVLKAAGFAPTTQYQGGRWKTAGAEPEQPSVSAGTMDADDGVEADPAQDAAKEGTFDMKTSSVEHVPSEEDFHEFKVAGTLNGQEFSGVIGIDQDGQDVKYDAESGPDIRRVANELEDSGHDIDPWFKFLDDVVRKGLKTEPGEHSSELEEMFRIDEDGQVIPFPKHRTTPGTDLGKPASVMKLPKPTKKGEPRNIEATMRHPGSMTSLVNFGHTENLDLGEYTLADVSGKLTAYNDMSDDPDSAYLVYDDKTQKWRA